MATATKKKRRQRAGKGRTPAIFSRRPAASAADRADDAPLPSKLSRSIIRRHHLLQKQKAQALAAGDAGAAAAIAAQIDAETSLELYQRASLSGQASERGGDTSKILRSWLEPVRAAAAAAAAAASSLGSGTKGQQPLPLSLPLPPPPPQQQQQQRLRMLEIGALSEHNACSRLGLFDVTRIDLHARGGATGIQRQDFMERPLPTCDAERFDMISLSLVLNYVPDAAARGRMLVRTTQFFRTPAVAARPAPPRKPNAAAASSAVSAAATAAASPPPPTEGGSSSSTSSSSFFTFFPSLFLVLPAPCVTNSRYLTEESLQQLMHGLGYTTLLQRKLSAKLAYYLWHFDPAAFRADDTMSKRERNPGKKRNNFAIVRK